MRVLLARTVDAFAETPFAGNPAGVVLDGEGLTESEMKLVAKEINYSETAFVGRDPVSEICVEGAAMGVACIKIEF